MHPEGPVDGHTGLWPCGVHQAVAVCGNVSMSCTLHQVQMPCRGSFHRFRQHAVAVTQLQVCRWTQRYYNEGI